jgi:hypothetical protein
MLLVKHGTEAGRTSISVSMAIIAKDPVNHSSPKDFNMNSPGGEAGKKNKPST